MGYDVPDSYKLLSGHRNDLSVRMALMPRRARYMSFWSSNCQHNLAGKWAVPSLADFFHHVVVVRFVPEFFSNADGSLVLGKLNSDTKRPGGGGEKIHKLEIRGPIVTGFCRFSAVWALLLKIQSAITPSILGVRGSSSGSRKLSPIPFDNMPNQA